MHISQQHLPPLRLHPVIRIRRISEALRWDIDGAHRSRLRLHHQRLRHRRRRRHSAVRNRALSTIAIAGRMSLRLSLTISTVCIAVSAVWHLHLTMCHVRVFVQLVGVALLAAAE